MRARPCTAPATWTTSACSASTRRASRSREQRFLGLYTSSAYNRRPWDIPLVRERHEYVMRESGLAPDQPQRQGAAPHPGNAAARRAVPVQRRRNCCAPAIGILGLQERVRSKLFLRRDRYGRFFSALVYIPRDRFNTDVRLRIEAMLKDALHGEHVDTNVLRRRIAAGAAAPDRAADAPARRSRSTTPRLEAELAEHRPQLAGRPARDSWSRATARSAGLALASRYGRALPAGYIEDVSAGGRRRRRRTPGRADRCRTTCA